MLWHAQLAAVVCRTQACLPRDAMRRAPTPCCTTELGRIWAPLRQPSSHQPCRIPFLCRRYLSALRSCFAAGGKEMVGFERYMALRKSGGNHCHFNAIAVPGTWMLSVLSLVVLPPQGVPACCAQPPSVLLQHVRAHAWDISPHASAESPSTPPTRPPPTPPHPPTPDPAPPTHPPPAAAAAAKAREAFEAGAHRHGFTFTHLPKVAGDAAAKDQLRNAGGCFVVLRCMRWCAGGMYPGWCSWFAIAGVLHPLSPSATPSAPCHAVGDGEYFVALLPDGSRLVHPIAYGERFPLNFGREVLAELAGVPEK